MIEASEYITAQTSDVVLVMRDMIVGTVVNGEAITTNECKDLNRGMQQASNALSTAERNDVG
jgi:hypothetical protein